MVPEHTCQIDPERYERLRQAVLAAGKAHRENESNETFAALIEAADALVAYRDTYCRIEH